MSVIDDILGKAPTPKTGAGAIDVAPPGVDVQIAGASGSAQPQTQTQTQTQISGVKGNAQEGGAVSPRIPGMPQMGQQAPGIDARGRMGQAQLRDLPQQQAPGIDARGRMDAEIGGIQSKGIVPPKLSYVEMYQKMNPYHPETAEERAKREKREKSEAVLAAVGDGISALSNLFFTSKYAPNAYDPSQGMSAKTRERWDRLKAEREANDRAYFDGYLRAIAMDDADDKTERSWRHTLEREAVADRYRDAADKRAELKDARQADIDELRLKLYQGRIDGQGYDNELKAIKAKYGEATEQLKQENIIADTDKKKRTGNGKGGSARAPWYAEDSDGKFHPLHGVNGERHAQNNADAHGWNLRTYDVEQYDRKGRLKGTTRHATGYGDQPQMPEAKRSQAPTAAQSKEEKRKQMGNELKAMGL